MGLAKQSHPKPERASEVRYKKRSLQSSRISPLPIAFVHQDMTSYSGLALVDRYLRLLDLHGRVREKLRHFSFRGDYGIWNLVVLVVLILIVGVERLSHIEYLKDDPLFRRVSRLPRLPHRTTLIGMLKQFTADSLKALIELNAELVIEQLQRLGLGEVTADIDGSVLSTRGHPTWAFKGYNPIRKGARSYFPLTAHIGETGHFLTILNRPGNVHDSKRAIHMLQLVRKALRGFVVRFRLDSAFCGAEIVDFLLDRGHRFAIKAPFWKLKLLPQAIRTRERWRRLDDTWSYFWTWDCLPKSRWHHPALVLRKRVGEPKAVQFDLFHPNNGVYEFMAILTDSTEWDPAELLAFMNGRSGHENSLGELKSDFAFDHIPTNQYQANSAYLLMSQMAYNVSLSMRHEVGLVQEHRAQNPKRTRFFRTWKMTAFRFLVLFKAGRIGVHHGKRTLALSSNEPTRQLYHRIGIGLEALGESLAA